MAINLQIGVKIFLKNKDKKFLLLKRSKGMWDLVGGRINPEETLMGGLKREINEETQLEFAGEVKLIAAQDIFFDDKHVVRLSYTGNIEGAVTIGGEHVDCGWFTTKEMENLEGLDPYVMELLEKNVIHET